MGDHCKLSPHTGDKLRVSGYRLSYEGQTLFVDPCLSRVPFRSIVSRRPALPSDAALDRFLHAPGETVGMLVGHTHLPIAPSRSSRTAPTSSAPSRCPSPPSVHSKLLLCLAVPYDGELSCEHLDSLARERWVDVFLAGVAGRSFTRDYWQRILPLLEPKAVVPTHYDNFFRPLGAEMEFVANVQLSELPEEIGAVSRDFVVAALPRSDRQDPGGAQR